VGFHQQKQEIVIEIGWLAYIKYVGLFENGVRYIPKQPFVSWRKPWFAWFACGIWGIWGSSFSAKAVWTHLTCFFFLFSHVLGK
jgi:hypothetical protein